MRITGSGQKEDRHTWLRAVEADLGPRNFDLVTAWRKATLRDDIVDSNVPEEYAMKEKRRKLYGLDTAYVSTLNLPRLA